MIKNLGATSSLEALLQTSTSLGSQQEFLHRSFYTVLAPVLHSHYGQLIAMKCSTGHDAPSEEFSGAQKVCHARTHYFGLGIDRLRRKRGVGSGCVGCVWLPNRPANRRQLLLSEQS